MVLEKDRGEINLNDHVKNEEVLHRMKEERNILYIIKRRMADFIGHILHRNKGDISEGKTRKKL
jgi:hypothetical protein